MKCEHREWMQPQSYMHENWRCADCGLTMTASEYAIFSELRHLRQMMAEQNKPIVISQCLNSPNGQHSYWHGSYRCQYCGHCLKQGT